MHFTSTTSPISNEDIYEILKRSGITKFDDIPKAWQRQEFYWHVAAIGLHLWPNTDRFLPHLDDDFEPETELAVTSLPAILDQVVDVLIQMANKRRGLKHILPKSPCTRQRNIDPRSLLTSRGWNTRNTSVTKSWSLNASDLCQIEDWESASSETSVWAEEASQLHRVDSEESLPSLTFSGSTMSSSDSESDGPQTQHTRQHTLLLGRALPVNVDPDLYTSPDGRAGSTWEHVRRHGGRPQLKTATPTRYLSRLTASQPQDLRSIFRAHLISRRSTKQRPEHEERSPSDDCYKPEADAASPENDLPKDSPSGGGGTSRRGIFVVSPPAEPQEELPSNESCGIGESDCEGVSSSAVELGCEIRNFSDEEGGSTPVQSIHTTAHNLVSPPIDEHQPHVWAGHGYISDYEAGTECPILSDDTGQWSSAISKSGISRSLKCCVTNVVKQIPGNKVMGTEADTALQTHLLQAGAVGIQGLTGITTYKRPDDSGLGADGAYSGGLADDAPPADSVHSDEQRSPTIGKSSFTPDPDNKRCLNLEGIIDTSSSVRVYPKPAEVSFTEQWLSCQEDTQRHARCQDQQDQKPSRFRTSPRTWKSDPPSNAYFAPLQLTPDTNPPSLGEGKSKCLDTGFIRRGIDPPSRSNHSPTPVYRVEQLLGKRYRSQSREYRSLKLCIRESPDRSQALTRLSTAEADPEHTVANGVKPTFNPMDNGQWGTVAEGCEEDSLMNDGDSGGNDKFVRRLPPVDPKQRSRPDNTRGKSSLKDESMRKPRVQSCCNCSHRIVRIRKTVSGGRKMRTTTAGGKLRGASMLYDTASPNMCYQQVDTVRQRQCRKPLTSRWDFPFAHRPELPSWYDPGLNLERRSMQDPESVGLLQRKDWRGTPRSEWKFPFVSNPELPPWYQTGMIFRGWAERCSTFEQVGAPPLKENKEKTNNGCEGSNESGPSNGPHPGFGPLDDGPREAPFKEPGDAPYTMIDNNLRPRFVVYRNQYSAPRKFRIKQFPDLRSANAAVEQMAKEDGQVHIQKTGRTGIPLYTAFDLKECPFQFSNPENPLCCTKVMYYVEAFVNHDSMQRCRELITADNGED